MNYISIIGVAVLLMSAWAMSYHRTEIKMRPIIWGIGLQFVFALIILREDIWSFLGMAILSSLIITYLMKGDEKPQQNIIFLLASFILSVFVIWGINMLSGIYQNIPQYLFYFTLGGMLINYFLLVLALKLPVLAKSLATHLVSHLIKRI